MSPRVVDFSPDRVHRYRLVRGPLDLAGVGMVTWVMLNPSVADENRDDPTVRRCIDFSTRWGFKFMQVVNLFAFVATDPDEMKAAVDPVGPENDAFIARAALEARETICAWGVHGGLRDRDRHVLEFMRAGGVKPLCLRLTKGGYPEHPLYMPGDTQRVPYEGRP